MPVLMARAFASRLRSASISVSQSRMTSAIARCSSRSGNGNRNRWSCMTCVGASHHRSPSCDLPAHGIAAEDVRKEA